MILWRASHAAKPRTCLGRLGRHVLSFCPTTPRGPYRQSRRGDAGNMFPTFKARRGSRWRGRQMLHYAVVFFIIALIAAVFGFGGIAAGAVGIAKVLFFIF